MDVPPEKMGHFGLLTAYQLYLLFLTNLCNNTLLHLKYERQIFKSNQKIQLNNTFVKEFLTLIKISACYRTQAELNEPVDTVPLLFLTR